MQFGMKFGDENGRFCDTPDLTPKPRPVTREGLQAIRAIEDRAAQVGGRDYRLEWVEEIWGEVVQVIDRLDMWNTTTDELLTLTDQVSIRNLIRSQVGLHEEADEPAWYLVDMVYGNFAMRGVDIEAVQAEQVLQSFSRYPGPAGDLLPMLTMGRSDWNRLGAAMMHALSPSRGPLGNLLGNGEPHVVHEVALPLVGLSRKGMYAYGQILRLKAAERDHRCIDVRCLTGIGPGFGTGLAAYIGRMTEQQLEIVEKLSADFSGTASELIELAEAI